MVLIRLLAVNRAKDILTKKTPVSHKPILESAARTKSMRLLRSYSARCSRWRRMSLFVALSKSKIKMVTKKSLTPLMKKTMKVDSKRKPCRLSVRREGRKINMSNSSRETAKSQRSKAGAARSPLTRMKTPLMKMTKRAGRTRKAW